MYCEHPAVVFFKKELAFYCAKCGERLISVESWDDYSYFCKWSGKSEKELLAGVFFYIKYYYVKLAKKLLKKK